MAIDFPDGSEVFVDANIFIYHFSGPTEYTDSCTQFLQRIEDGELLGLTSMLVVAETLHRLMIIEATSKLQIEPRLAKGKEPRAGSKEQRPETADRGPDNEDCL